MTRVDAIADPVRLAVARRLAGRPRASAAEVAASVGIHLNTARAHLGALAEAGVVERLSESGGRRGRPVVRYRLRAGWAPRGDELLSLSALLATALLELGPSPAELRAAAVGWGRRWAAENDTGPVEVRLAAALSRLGFEARVLDGRLALSACPCPLIAPDSPELVCALADAVIDGVLEGSRLAARERVHDPDARRCSTTLAPA